MKSKTKTDVKKKLRDKKKILEENGNKFDIYSEDTTNCDSYTDFNKYHLDRDKS